MRWLALALALLAGTAHAAPCKGVVLAVRGSGVPASLVPVADESLRSTLEGRGGCALVAPQAVSDMIRMIGPGDRPGLARSLLADWVVEATLSAQAENVEVVVTAVTPAGGTVTQRSTVPVVRMLPTLQQLAVEAVAGLRTAPASQAVPSGQPQSQPTSQPATLSPPPPVAAAPPPPVAAPPAPVSTVKQPAPAPVRRQGETRALFAAGLRGYYVKTWQRGGPVVELGAGAMSNIYSASLLLRSYFGDRTGYFLGGGGELGPRIGPLRLSFGGDLGFLFIPDTLDNIDMVIVNLHPAGVVLELGKLVLHLDALSIDLYLVPINEEIGRDPEFLWGLSAGLTVGVGL